MDNTIALYQEVILKDRKDRLDAIIPLPAMIRKICKREIALQEHYEPIVKYIQKIIKQDIDEIYKNSLAEAIAEFEDRFGDSYSNETNIDIIDYYNNVLFKIIDEIDYPWSGGPTEKNRAIIVKEITPISIDSIRIHAFPIEVFQGPAESIRIQKQTITINSDFDQPINFINPLTGKKTSIKFQSNFD